MMDPIDVEIAGLVAEQDQLLAASHDGQDVAERLADWEQRRADVQTRLADQMAAQRARIAELSREQTVARVRAEIARNGGWRWSWAPDCPDTAAELVDLDGLTDGPAA